MTKDVAIIFDCGATNLRVIAINLKGEIVSSCSIPNETDADPYLPGGKIWDLEKIWGKLCKASKNVISKIDPKRIIGTTVTTFGVDGTFINKKGELLYPVISWQCQRTEAIIENIEKYIPLSDLYRISGVYPYAFNTINKILWIKENNPEIINNSYRFLFISSLLINKLSGSIQNDSTMMGTSMMADLKIRDFSDVILDAIGLNRELFGQTGEPGDQVGFVTQKASVETGLPAKTPVILAGHDTQFAIFGSGAKYNQLVLSSGTWEILMARSKTFSASSTEMNINLTTEADAIPGIYNIGQNWLGSGVLEWFSSQFYPELKGTALYNQMTHDAEIEKPGSETLIVDPTIYDDNTGRFDHLLKELHENIKRGQIYRALLEGLSFRLKEGMEALEASGDFETDRIICVGGGSKNNLWNQLRADICQKSIQLINQKETTALGAALFVFAGTNYYDSVDEARSQIDYNPQLIMPNTDNNTNWNKLYFKYLKLKSQHLNQKYLH